MQILKIAFLQNAYFSEFAIMMRNCFFILNSDQKSIKVTHYRAVNCFSLKIVIIQLHDYFIKKLLEIKKFFHINIKFISIHGKGRV